MDVLIYPEVHLVIVGVVRERNRLIWTLKEDDGTVHIYQTGTRIGPRIYRLLHIEHVDGDPKKHIGKDVYASRVYITISTMDRDIRKIALTEDL